MDNIIKLKPIPRDETQAKVLRLESFIRHNIIQLAELRRKIAKLEKEITRTKLRVVRHQDDKSSTEPQR